MTLGQSMTSLPTSYEMYTGEAKPTVTISGEQVVDGTNQSSNSDALPIIEPGRAVEVLELANGETIW